MGGQETESGFLTSLEEEDEEERERGVQVNSPFVHLRERQMRKAARKRLRCCPLLCVQNGWRRLMRTRMWHERRRRLYVVASLSLEPRVYHLVLKRVGVVLRL